MDGKMDSLMLSGEKQATFEALLDDIERVGSIPTGKDKKEDWIKHYENWTYMLLKSYEDALQKEKLDEVFNFNRKLGKIAKIISGFALLQGNAYLYSMGIFIGTFHAVADMLPGRNKEQTFNIRMAEVIGRVYVKQVLESLYKRDHVQHKDLCDKLGISPSQLNRVMGELSDIGCVKRYSAGKYAFYSLTSRGKKYVHEFLGCRKEEYIDYESVMLAGRKPQIDRKERESDMPDLEEEYRIDYREDKMEYEKFVNMKLAYSKGMEGMLEGNLYE